MMEIFLSEPLTCLCSKRANLAMADMPLVYDKNHMILGQGNFVLTVSEGRFRNKHVSFYDLFRLENGKLVEHWDTSGKRKLEKQ